MKKGRGRDVVVGQIHNLHAAVTVQPNEKTISTGRLYCYCEFLYYYVDFFSLIAEIQFLTKPSRIVHIPLS